MHRSVILSGVIFGVVFGAAAGLRHSLAQESPAAGNVGVVSAEDPFATPTTLPGSPYGRGYSGYSADGVTEGFVGNRVVTSADPRQQAERTHAEKTRLFVARYRQATDSAEREKLAAELKQTVQDQFETRQQMRAAELKELEAQLRRLQELHERREKEKDQIVSDRVRQLLRDAEGLGWGAREGVDAADATAGSILRSN